MPVGVPLGHSPISYSHKQHWLSALTLLLALLVLLLLLLLFIPAFVLLLLVSTLILLHAHFDPTCLVLKCMFWTLCLQPHRCLSVQKWEALLPQCLQVKVLVPGVVPGKLGPTPGICQTASSFLSSPLLSSPLLSSPLLSLLFSLSYSLLLKPSLLLLLSFSLLLKPSLLLFLSVSLLLKPTLLLLLSFSLLLKPSLLLFLVFSSQAWCGSSARPDNDQATHSSDDTCPGSREFKTTQRNCYLSSRNFV